MREIINLTPTIVSNLTLKNRKPHSLRHLGKSTCNCGCLDMANFSGRLDPYMIYQSKCPDCNALYVYSEKKSFYYGQMEADRTVFETRASYEVMKQKRKEKDEGVVAEVVVEKPIGAHLTLVGDESTGFYDKAKLIDDALES